MSEGPKNRRLWLAAILGLAMLSLGPWWAVHNGTKQAAISGEWTREIAPGTNFIMILRPDGTGSQTQNTSQEGIPSPQLREFRWLIDGNTIAAFSPSRLPWWCEDWMIEVYVMFGYEMQEQAEIVSVSDKELILRAGTSGKDVVFQRVRNVGVISHNLGLD